MERISINIGSIALLAVVFYFVIKTAVKNGINESYLFSNKQRKEMEYREIEETYESIDEKVPDFLKEYYEKSE